MNRKPFSARARVVVVSVVALTSSGCAMKGDIRLLQQELRAVSARQDSLMAEIRNETLQTQDTLRNQGDAMFDLRGDINRQLQQISQSLTRLEAIAGENQRGLTSVRDQLANMRRMPTGGASATVTVPDSTRDPGSESLLGGGAGGADELWATAQELAGRESLRSAATAYEQFIGQYPNDERAPDAHFYLADILGQQDRPEDALNTFQDVQRLYPASPKVADALYRIAVLQVDLEQVDEAKATLERLVNTYPGTTFAMLARDLLEQIG